MPRTLAGVFRLSHVTPVCCLLAGILITSGPVRAAIAWDPIPPAELAANAPVVESSVDLGVEVLLRETSIDENDRRGNSAYVRTKVRYKVFDARGVQALRQIDIRFDATEQDVTAIAARVVKPDGTTVEVERAGFHFREILRNRYLRYKVVSFSPPALEPGVIVEYQMVVRGDVSYAGYFPLQDEYPTRLVRLLIKPPAVSGLRILTLYHRCPALPVKKNRAGFFETTLELVPGMVEEPFAPPEERSRLWMIYFYALESPKVDAFWPTWGMELFKEHERLLKPDASIRQACAEIITGAETEEDKVRRLDLFCRTRIKNLDIETRHSPSARIKRTEKLQAPAETLAQREGEGRDVQLLFVALAREAGLDARIARCSSRAVIAFSREMIVGLTVPDQLVAVHVGDEWRFVQPELASQPFGLLHWTNEGETVLLSDPRQPRFLTTPVAPASASENRRHAQLELDADGTLSGDVTLTLTGHWAADLRGELKEESAGRREEIVRERFRERLPAAELRNIRFAGVDTFDDAVSISYHLRIPDYAVATGQRWFLPPSVFEQGATRTFEADARKHPVMFPFAGVERDRVEIKLPADLVPETALRLESLYDSPVLEYFPRLTLRRDEHMIVYERVFELKELNLPPGSYPAVRQAFNHVLTEDAKVLSLRRADAGEVAALKSNH